MKLMSWVSASRPKTLSAVFVPILAATCFGYFHGSFDIYLSFFALISSLCIQIATNLFNDAIDFKKGADSETRIGPKRASVSGEIAPKTVMLAGFLCLALAVLFAIPLVLAGGTPIVYVGVLSLIFAYIYTGGPYPLAYLGIADLFVVLFFGLIAVGALTYIHLGYFLPSSLVLGFQLGLLCNLMLAINNLRDHETDKLVHKNTLAVRFGANFVRAEICFLFFVPFLLNVFWYFKGMYFTALLNFLLFPVAVVLCYRIIKIIELRKLNPMLGLCSLYYISFGILTSLALVLDHG